MSLSSSNSSNPVSNYSEQLSTQGGSGSNSPTIVGSGNTITDAGQTANALAAVQNVALAALGNSQATNEQALQELSDFNAKQASAQVSSTQSENSLLSSVLANNQTLAQNVQSGGATTGMQLTTKVVIGALVIMGLLVGVLLFRK